VFCIFLVKVWQKYVFVQVATIVDEALVASPTTIDAVEVKEKEQHKLLRKEESE
jgi:hypothetical protein